MNTYLTMKGLVFRSVVMFILVGAPVSSVLSVYAQDKLVEGAMILAPVEGSSRTGKVSVDTLESCLVRIPERVTPEQRMMAQQKCHEEESRRKLEPLAVKGD